MTGKRLSRAELVEAVSYFEAIFDQDAADGPSGMEPYQDDDSARAFGLAIDADGFPADQAAAEATGGPTYICTLDDGTQAHWGAKKPLPGGFVSRELVFRLPGEQGLRS